MVKTDKTHNLNQKPTVIPKFISSKKIEENYQTEDQLEKAFISQLENQQYDYLNITTNEDLIENLKTQLEKLNNYKFSKNEWETFFKKEIANKNHKIEDKTKIIQEDSTKTLIRDNGSSKNIRFIDKKNIENNSLQVINQYTTKSGQRENRYDVTILVNGLPLIHVELKKRGIKLKEAFNQIRRYQRESFWSDSGLFKYVQLFIISNGTKTKYFSNTTRDSRIKELSNKNINPKEKKSSHSYEFTNIWADSTNTPIHDLTDFTETFFAKHTILNILTKYCVFTSENQLLVMRPYQIVATEKIIDKVNISTKKKLCGTIDAGGFIWHTTGSGKTLTSFKAAQLATKIETVKKVLFVVDRKDLDYQTMKEYDKFEKGAANSNTSTAKLKKQIEDPKSTIIITTIQKLDKFIKKNSDNKIFNEHMILIFDECHRSQFGDMHKAIKKSFNNYHLFGFTGTPIFAKNSSSSGTVDLRTTEQAFGEKLHTYTIVDAISDKNVLKFKVDYVETMKQAEDSEDKKITDIDRKAALESPKRISNIVKYIHNNFDDKTKKNRTYSHKITENITEVLKSKNKKKVEKIMQNKRLSGFNSIFAVSSIEMAKKYYLEFDKHSKTLPINRQLKVATIFSYGANDEENEIGVTDENPEDTSELSKTDRDFLEKAIKDYNKLFKTSYDTSKEKFQNYYKDISERVKNREIDVLIVVNMFLTGFDAPTLNTLWVDKNLKSHGLIQAYSRTNRILNAIKTHGNIVCFRNLEKATNDAISLFGDKNARGIVLLKSYDEYYNGYTEKGKEIRGYKSLVEELKHKFPIGEEPFGEQNKKDFIKLFGGILRIKNILTTFDEFIGNEILTDRELQDYTSMYQDLYEEFRSEKNNDKENINDDLVFEMELIKQTEINIDFIISLITKYHKNNIKDKEILSDINRMINSSTELRNKKDLIEEFIESLKISKDKDDVDKEWEEFLEKKKTEELDLLIKSENLFPEQTKSFIEKAFGDGYIQSSGTMLSNIIKPVSRFTKTNESGKKRSTVVEKLNNFFDRFFRI